MKRTTWFVSTTTALLLLALAVSLPASTSPVLAQASGLDVVQTDAGLVAPARDSTAEVRIFKMIPYAAPPVSALRWKPPQPVTPWQGVRKADFFSPWCMGSIGHSPGTMFYLGHQGMSEDCLYLNVWTPAKTGAEKLPVLVIMVDPTTGGSYQTVEPAALAKRGIVGVTLNYRNAVFGWLAHPELDKEPGSNNASGNYHYLDIIAALQWVQKNIAAFGGDPTNVTLWGSVTSTGYASNLTASPLAKGLFQKVVGAGISAFYAHSSAGPAKALTHAAATQAWMDWAKKNFNATTIAELRTRTAWDLLKPALPYPSGWALDGYVLTDNIDTIYAKGQQNDVPVLLGWDKDAGTYAPPMASTVVSYTAAIQARFGKSADQFLQLYPAKTDAEAVAQSQAYLGDGFGWADWEWAKAHARTSKTNTYVYYWTYAPPWSPGVKFAQADPATKLGAYLASENSYLLQTLNVFASQREYTDVDYRLSDLVSSYLVNFIKTGDPNGPFLPTWPAFDEKVDNSVLYLGAPQIQVGPVPNKARLEFLGTFYRSQAPAK